MAATAAFVCRGARRRVAAQHSGVSLSREPKEVVSRRVKKALAGSGSERAGAHVWDQVSAERGRWCV